MISDIIYLILRTSLILIVLLILTRFLGKKQVSQLTFFNYVTGVTIGSVAGDFISDNLPIIDAIVSLSIICILTEVNSLLALKSLKYRKVMNGQEIILIKKGKLIKEALEKTRLNSSNLLMLLREAGVFSLEEIEYAILENDGGLSIIKTPKNQYLVKSDMSIKTNPINNLPRIVISDGKIIKENLKQLNLNEDWLNDQLAKLNINSSKNVFYAEVKSDGSLYVS